MRGHETFREAVARLSLATHAGGRRPPASTLDEIDLFVYHQANGRILAAVGERLGLPPERVVDCIGEYGNTSAATLPLALAYCERAGPPATTATGCCSARSAPASPGAPPLSSGGGADEPRARRPPRTDADPHAARAARGAVRPGLAAAHPHRRAARCRWASKARAGDGVVGGSGMVDGRPVFCYAQDSSYAGGSLGAGPRRHDRPRAGAGRSRPRAGGRVRLLGRRPHAGGRGRARRLRADLPPDRRSCPGGCPQISIITGVSAGGGAYSPALTDWVVMTEDASMFLTGPGVVREALGEDVDRRRARRHARARAQRRLPLRRPDRRSTPPGWPASCSATCPRHRDDPLPPPCRRPPAGARSRRPSCPARRAASTTCAR